jgi:hypothetical protein
MKKMKRDELIKKVQALRALAGDSASSLAEAATAARLAEQIIQKNALEEAEFEVTNGEQEAVGNDTSPIEEWGQRQTVWQSSLLLHLSHAYGCEGIISHRNGKLGFYAVGRPTDIATMRYQYAYFHLELTRLAHLLAPRGLSRGDGKNWFNSFYLGAVKAIGESLETTKEEVQSQASQAALAVIDKRMDDVHNLYRKLYPNARLVKRYSRWRRDAYAMGQQAGAGLKTKPELNTGFRGLLGQ